MQEKRDGWGINISIQNLEGQGGIFLQNKNGSHGDIQFSSYSVSKCLGNLFPGHLEKLKCQIVCFSLHEP